MLDIKKNSHQTYPSLLPLRMALVMAASESPARPPRMDANEQRAMQLIEKLKAEHKKQQVVLTWNDIPSPNGIRTTIHEMTVMQV
jgi:hypothetical protein